MKLFNFLIHAILFGLLLTVFVLEGCGIPNGRVISLHLITASPCVLYGIVAVFRKKICFPSLLSGIFVFFLILVSLSTVTAVRVQTAFEYQLFYTSLFLLFIFTYNYKQLVSRALFSVITVVTVVICFYAGYLLIFPDFAFLGLPINGYQFVYSYLPYLGHHPIGAFIIIPLSLAVTTFFMRNSWKVALTTIFCFLVLIISSLRTAYISFIVSGLFLSKMYWKKITSQIIPFIVAMLMIVLAFVLITDFFKIDLVQKFIPYGQKELIRGREQYLNQTLHAIQERPIVGYGSAGYFYASMKFAGRESEITESSHNIILDIGVENGILAMILFTGFLVLVSRSVFLDFPRTKNIHLGWYTTFVALLLLFQFQYYHRIYILFTIFIIISGLIYKEKEEIHDKYHLTTAISIILFILTCFIGSAKALYTRGNVDASLAIYPIYFAPYRDKTLQLVEQRDKEGAFSQLSIFTNLYPDDPYVMDFVGDTYLMLDQSQLARVSYQRSIDLFPTHRQFQEKLRNITNTE